MCCRDNEHGRGRGEGRDKLVRQQQKGFFENFREGGEINFKAGQGQRGNNRQAFRQAGAESRTIKGADRVHDSERLNGVDNYGKESFTTSLKSKSAPPSSASKCSSHTIHRAQPYLSTVIDASMNSAANATVLLISDRQWCAPHKFTKMHKCAPL